jgi:hypothetical protein
MYNQAVSYQVIAGDWIQLENIINDLATRFLTQSLTPTSTPTFAGLTLTGLSGVLKATAGLISGSSTFDNLSNGSSTTMRTNLNADLLDGNHASAFQIAGSYESPLTFSFPLIRTVDTISFGYNTTNLQLTANQLNTIQDINTGASPRFNILGIGTAAESTCAISAYKDYSTVTSGAVYGFKFYPVWGGANNSSGSINGVACYPELFGAKNVYGINAFYAQPYCHSTYTGLLTNAISFNSSPNISGTTCTITNLFGFAAYNGYKIAGATVTNNYAFYDAGQTIGSTNWGLAINTQSYINANLSIGKNTAPTVSLDVTGAGLFSTTLGVIGLTTCTGGISLPASANIALATTTGTKIGTATSQLLGFYNATPVNQPDTVSDATTQDLTGTDTVDKTKLETDLTSCKNAINTIIDRLMELGLIATV